MNLLILIFKNARFFFLFEFSNIYMIYKYSRKQSFTKKTIRADLMN